MSLGINNSKRGHLKLKKVHSLLFFKLLGWQLANEYSSLFQQPERINYIPQMLKLLLENKLYRRPSWSDASSQSKCILGKVLLWCVCMYAYVWWVSESECVCVYVRASLRSVVKKWITDRHSLSRNNFIYSKLHSILPISPGTQLHCKKPQKWYPLAFL